jgi:hypothetical protein
MKADQCDHRVQKPTIYYTIDITINATGLKIWWDLNDTLIIIGYSEYLCNIAAYFSCASNEYEIFLKHQDNLTEILVDLETVIQCGALFQWREKLCHTVQRLNSVLLLLISA